MSKNPHRGQKLIGDSRTEKCFAQGQKEERFSDAQGKNIRCRTQVWVLGAPRRRGKKRTGSWEKKTTGSLTTGNGPRPKSVTKAKKAYAGYEWTINKESSAPKSVRGHGNIDHKVAKKKPERLLHLGKEGIWSVSGGRKNSKGGLKSGVSEQGGQQDLGKHGPWVSRKGAQKRERLPQRDIENTSGRTTQHRVGKASSNARGGSPRKIFGPGTLPNQSKKPGECTDGSPEKQNKTSQAQERGEDRRKNV